MKFAWRQSVIDVAAWNSSKIEQVDLKEYKDLFVADVEHAAHELDVDEQIFNYL